MTTKAGETTTKRPHTVPALPQVWVDDVEIQLPPPQATCRSRGGLLNCIALEGKIRDAERRVLIVVQAPRMRCKGTCGQVFQQLKWMAPDPGDRVRRLKGSLGLSLEW